MYMCMCACVFVSVCSCVFVCCVYARTYRLAGIHQGQLLLEPLHRPAEITLDVHVVVLLIRRFNQEPNAVGCDSGSGSDAFVCFVARSIIASGRSCRWGRRRRRGCSGIVHSLTLTLPGTFCDVANCLLRTLDTKWSNNASDKRQVFLVGS